MKTTLNPPEDPVILLVEDDPEEREVYRSLLVCQGYIVLEAESFDRASRILSKYEGIIDRVISDNRMDDMAIGEKMKNICDFLRIPCLVISGQKSASVDFEKPLPWTEVFSTLRAG